MHGAPFATLLFALDESAVSKGFWPLKTAETAGPRRHGSGESTGALPFQGVIGNNRAYGVAWERAVAGTAARAVLPLALQSQNQRSVGKRSHWIRRGANGSAPLLSS